MKKLWTTVVGIAAVSMLMAGCTSGASPDDQTSTDTGEAEAFDSVTIGVVPVVDFSPVYIAQREGIFEKYNLDAVSYTHIRAHETVLDLVCRVLLEKKKRTRTTTKETNT